jgi:hypothetical protein
MSDPSTSPSDPVLGAAAFTDLHTRARRVGQWAWIERQVFELFGGWAGTTDDPAVAVLLGEMSRRHGWHAELFHDRLPELASVDAAALVVAPGPGTLALFAGLRAPAEPAALCRPVGAYRVVLPLLVAEYRAASESLSMVAEPSLQRWLGIVLRDDLEEWARGQVLLASMLGDPDAVRAAGARQLELDLLAVGTGQLTR